MRNFTGNTSNFRNRVLHQYSSGTTTSSCTAEDKRPRPCVYVWRDRKHNNSNDLLKYQSGCATVHIVNIDERLAALAARHEALALSLELMSLETEALKTLSKQLLATAQQDGENIRALVRIAETHEHGPAGPL